MNGSITVVLAMAVLLMSGAAATPSLAQDAVRLTGSGATFPFPIYSTWFKAFGATHKSMTVDYQGKGSGAGIQDFINRTVDFAASDAAMTDEDIAKVPGGVVLLPATAGEIALAYNLPGNPKGVKLPRDVYSGIFLGKITKWSDPKIKAANPGVTLPAQDAPATIVSTRWALRPGSFRRRRRDRAATSRRRATTAAKPSTVRVRRPSRAADIRLSARTVPPSPTSGPSQDDSTSLSWSTTTRWSRATSRPSGGSWRRNRAEVRTTPSGTLTSGTMWPSRTWLTCRLPPPRSTMVASCCAPHARAARAPSRASSCQLRTRTSVAGRSRSGASSVSLLRASRTAAVATTTVR